MEEWVATFPGRNVIRQKVVGFIEETVGKNRGITFPGRNVMEEWVVGFLYETVGRNGLQLFCKKCYTAKGCREPCPIHFHFRKKIPKKVITISNVSRETFI
jgi:hypothetical protein